MATNGESATRWLAEHGETASQERLEKIRNTISDRIEQHEEEDNADMAGLLEALDVMDTWLQQRFAEPEPESSAALDLSSLTAIETDDDQQPLLSPEEKQRRFRQLLKTGQVDTILK